MILSICHQLGQSCRTRIKYVAGFFDAAEVISRKRIPLLPQCGICGLLHGCQSPKMPVTGEGRLGVLIVAEAPGAEEDKRNEQLVGDAGQELRRACRSIDVDLDRDCWKTNSLICFISPKVLIYTSEGYKQIKDVSVGDMVLTHLGRFRKVLSRSQDLPLEMRRNKEQLVDITFGRHKLTVTADHLFYGEDNWVRADQLIVGSKIKALGVECDVCGRVYFKHPGRFDKAGSECSQKCHNVAVGRKNGPAVSRALLKQYKDGTRDAYEITRRAHDVVNALAADGKWNPAANRSESGKELHRCKTATTRQAHNSISDAVFVVGKGESEVADFLLRRGIEFYSQYAIDGKNVDFYLPTYSMVVEVENVRPFGFRRKYREEYYTKREKLAASIGAKIVFLRSEQPDSELERLLMNDNHSYKFLYISVDSVVVRNQRRQMYLYCLEVDDDSSYVSLGLVSHNCRPEGNRKPTKNEIDYCRPNLINTIKELKPKVIIPLGGTAIRSMLGPHWREDVGEVTTWVGWRIPLHRPNVWVAPNYHPSYVLREEKDKSSIAPVLKLWFRRHLEAAFTLTDRPWGRPPDYASQVRVELDPDAAAGWIRSIIHRGGATSFDYETNMLKPDSDEAEIVSCAICWRGKETVAYPMVGEAVTATKEYLLSDLPKIGANEKFEDRWSRSRLGCAVVNGVWDCMQSAHHLDCRSGITSVKFQAFVRLGQEPWDVAIRPYLVAADGGNAKNRIRQADMRTLLLYNGLDSLMEYYIGGLQRAEMMQQDSEPIRLGSVR